MRCPVCHRNGTFEKLLELDLYLPITGHFAGIRRCPNPECYAVAFVVLHLGKLVLSFPAERVDFDASEIPEAIKSSFEEAITCHSSACHIAAAIMVRKTLELICHDRGASGRNLKDRLESLSTKLILPPELFQGLDDLRLLGNDAAHLESQVFAQIGEQEVSVCIEFTKEVLKATYQYANLLAKLRALKRPPNEEIKRKPDDALRES